MSKPTKFFIAILILAHVYFFYKEWFWLDDPVFQSKLGFIGCDQSEVAIVGKNQAFSNLALAGGLVFGWLSSQKNADWGRAILRFFLGVIFLAGLVGFYSIPALKWAFLVAQSGPALAGLGSLAFGPKK